MTPTPTPAPALTDEQIDGGFDSDGIRLMYESLVLIWAERYGDTRAVSDWYAAVIARAKREAAEEIAGELEAAAAGMGNDLDDYGRGLRNGFRLASRRAEGGADHD